MNFYDVNFPMNCIYVCATYNISLLTHHEKFLRDYFLRTNCWKASNNLFIVFPFVVKNWIIKLCDTGQVNNAGIPGTIITDPDALRSIVVASQVSFHVLFLWWL